MVRVLDDGAKTCGSYLTVRFSPLTDFRRVKTDWLLSGF